MPWNFVFLQSQVSSFINNIQFFILRSSPYITTKGNINRSYKQILCNISKFLYPSPTANARNCHMPKTNSSQDISMNPWNSNRTWVTKNGPDMFEDASNIPNIHIFPSQATFNFGITNKLLIDFGSPCISFVTLP